MSDDSKRMMDTEDVAATFAGFAIAISVAVSGKKRSSNEILGVIGEEMRGLVRGMRKRGDDGSPASEAMLLIAAMLDESAPPSLLEASASEGN